MLGPDDTPGLPPSMMPVAATAPMPSAYPAFAFQPPHRQNFFDAAGGYDFMQPQAQPQQDGGYYPGAWNDEAWQQAHSPMPPHTSMEQTWQEFDTRFPASAPAQPPSRLSRGLAGAADVLQGAGQIYQGLHPRSVSFPVRPQGFTSAQQARFEADKDKVAAENRQRALIGAQMTPSMNAGANAEYNAEAAHRQRLAEQGVAGESRLGVAGIRAQGNGRTGSAETTLRKYQTGRIAALYAATLRDGGDLEGAHEMGEAWLLHAKVPPEEVEVILRGAANDAEDLLRKGRKDEAGIGSLQALAGNRNAMTGLVQSGEVAGDDYARTIAAMTAEINKAINDNPITAYLPQSDKDVLAQNELQRRLGAGVQLHKGGGSGKTTAAPAPTSDDAELDAFLDALGIGAPK